jgi:pantoate--beta-alanine ligase
MGSLHAGHLSLVRRAQRDNDSVLVSIFVNPTQFGPNEDFKKYPRSETKDLRLLKKLKVDAVFIPRSPREIYRYKDESRIIPRKNLTQMMEAKIRPHHFEGVATVVFKLFQLANPDRAYFGEKDFQQLRIIDAMVDDLFLPIKIIACRTVRESSGLALSSRNQYLDKIDRSLASKIHTFLKNSKTLSMARRRLKREGFKVQYLESWDPSLMRAQSKGRRRWLVAVLHGGVRLIDNIEKY